MTQVLTTKPSDLTPVPIRRIMDAFYQLGNGRYGSEQVTQLQHALQTATMALEASASDTQVVAALLHDLGHILPGGELPSSDEPNLDDRHEELAYEWLRSHFGDAVAEPVRLHVAAKRYLCSTRPEYEGSLSPTSLKSYFDQGGPMDDAELAEFRSGSFFEQAIQLREWDDRAKDPNKVTPPFEYFLDQLKACLRSNA